MLFILAELLNEIGSGPVLEPVFKPVLEPVSEPVLEPVPEPVREELGWYCFKPSSVSLPCV